MFIISCMKIKFQILLTFNHLKKYLIIILIWYILFLLNVFKWNLKKKTAFPIMPSILKQVWSSTILSSTIKIDLVRLSFGLRSIKSNIALIKHNCCPDLVRLMVQSNLCTTATLGTWKMWPLCRGLYEKDQW